MKLGTHTLYQPLFLAPMEDITDLSFRLICKKLLCDVTVTEFTAAEALVRNIPKAVKKISISPQEHPVGIQLFGSRPEAIREAAAFAETLGPDFIDLNCGCWVKNHVSRTEGAGLLKDLPLFEKIVRAAVSGTKLPVTVKTRLGWDQRSIVILDAAKMIEQSGAQMLTLHCRTRSQAHRGLADWSWLEKVKRTISIPLVGNGDINSPQDVKAMLQTGCDGVMIGRGAVANPWIFQQAKHYLQTGALLAEPSTSEKIKLCIEHLEHSFREKSCRNPVVTFRKHYCGYLKGIPGITQLRRDLMTMETLAEVKARLEEFTDDHAS
jgi:tRNA-dihydrouridine synthase B